MSTRARVACSIFALWWCCGVVAVAAPVDDDGLPQIHHTAWTPKDGAPAQIVALAQTADGWLWLATTTGLYRFDGVSFERIDEVDGVVRTVFALADGGLWIGYSRGGASLLKGGRFTHFGEAEGLPPASLHEFALDGKGRLWAAAQNGLFRFDGSRWTRIELQAGAASGDVTSVVADRAGTVWVRAAEQVFALPGDATSFRPVARFAPGDSWIYLAVSPDGGAWASCSESGLHALSLDGAPAEAPRSLRKGAGTGPLHFDHEGRLWVTRAGGVEFALRSTLPARDGPGHRLFTPAQGLSGEFGYAVIEDREGNVWFGSEGGLDRFRRSRLHTLNSSGSGYAAVAAGEAGQVMLAGLHKGRIVGGAFRAIGPDPDFVPTSVYVGARGTAWMGGRAELWRVDGDRADRVPLPGAVGPNDLVQAIVEDAAGRLWISVRSATSNVYSLAGDRWTPWQDAPDELRGTAPNVMAADAHGKLWFGYPNNRIAVLDGSAARVFAAADGLQVGDVLVIQTRGDRTWAGGSRGVALFERDRFRSLAGTPGAPLRAVSGIVATAAGELWLNGSEGITRIPKSELELFLRQPDHAPRFERFDAGDGLEGIAPLVRPVPTAVEGMDGKLWFSTSRGLYWLDPAHIERNLVEPPVLVRSIQADGRTFEPAAELALPKHTHSLAIAYTALSLSRPQRVRFRVRLEGVDPDWRDVGPVREAFYAHLGPGRYVFRVQAANDDGVWNTAGTSLAFSIEPAFYQAGWFRGVFATMALGVFYLVCRWQVRRANWRLLDKLQERQSERERIARELHDTLLQSVSGLMLHIESATQKIPEHEPAHQAMATALDVASQVLAEGRDRVLDLRRCGESGRGLYEALADVGRQLGHGRPSRVRIILESAPRDLRDEVLDEVFLIAREALTNAFRHAQARRIEVSLVFAWRELRVRVRDDGCGIDPRFLEAGRSGHWGLRGMRERASRIGGQLHIRSDARRGTKLELKVPAQRAYRNVGAAWWTRWRWIVLARRPTGRRADGPP